MELYVTLFLAAAVVRLGWMVAGAVLNPVADWVRGWGWMLRNGERWILLASVTPLVVVLAVGAVAGWLLAGGGR